MKFFFDASPSDIVFETKPYKIILSNDKVEDVKQTKVNPADLLENLNKRFYTQ